MATVDIDTSTIEMDEKEYTTFMRNVYADKNDRTPSKEIQETVKKMNEITEIRIDGVVVSL